MKFICKIPHQALLPCLVEVCQKGGGERDGWGCAFCNEAEDMATALGD